MPAEVRRNERSWAIEMISTINAFADSNDLMVKRAGGENTVTQRTNRMFPDIILYGNREQSLILQGWEVKMPDVPIEDGAFIQDAQRKARALSLNSCLIWNFTYAVLYRREENDEFIQVKQWNETSHIRTREDVQTYRSDWEALLRRVILEVNGFFVTGEFRQISVGDIVSNAAITVLIDRNKVLAADELRSRAVRDTTISAFINAWWQNVRLEYAHDENDPFRAYAKGVVLNWANRLIFAHIIKHRQNAAMRINDLDYTRSPGDANDIFQSITAACDFYNVFNSIRYDDILPALTWQDLVEFSLFLRGNGIDELEQRTLQNVLEGTVNSTRRELNGQFTTPVELAKLLVKLTVRDWTEDFLDCCCGTGSIPHIAIREKTALIGVQRAVETVWACDKYQYPLQIANISMASTETIDLASRLFQHNAMLLRPGETINVVNPRTGMTDELTVPEMGAIASNLPFVPFENIPSDDKQIISAANGMGMDARADLYCYIAASLAGMLKSGGRLGIITSNSWLGTIAGKQFFSALRELYEIEQVHISGKGRWFQNAQVVTTILILRKRTGDVPERTSFFLWKKSLRELAENEEEEGKLINSAILSQELDRNVVSISTYSREEIDAFSQLNISYNALFHHVGWLSGIIEKAIPIRQAFRVIRGSRRGWDALFYPRAGNHRIEADYLKRVLMNARKVTSLTAAADRDAFCCSKTKEELRRLNHAGALAWIEQFEGQTNKVGKPLPEVLAGAGMKWYELQDHEVAEFFTAMNPDQRLFFGRFETPSFINQRLIGLVHKPGYEDAQLNHALLNSIFTMFYIEACGFGRGLGVLDIKKEGVADCYMLNPALVDDHGRREILAAFERLKARPIYRVSEELADPVRMEFEHAVFRALGIEEYLERVSRSLLSMQNTRLAVTHSG